MTRPMCPNCRQAMSSAEIGFDGVWSCIYCEGTWLSAGDLETLSAAGKVEGFVLPDLPVAKANVEERLACPCGAPQSIVAVLLAASKLNCCTSCRSMFFRKGVLRDLAPQVGAGGVAPLAVLKAVGSAALWATGVVVAGGA